MKKVLSLIVLVMAFGLLAPSTAKANILFLDHFDILNWVNNGTGNISLGSSGASPDGGKYMRLDAGAFQHPRTTKDVSTVGNQNIVVSFWAKTLSVMDNIITGAGGPGDYSDFRFRPTGTENWSNFQIVTGEKWNFYSFSLPSFANNGSFSSGFHLVNAGSGHDYMLIDGFKVTGDPIVPEPATMLLLGSGLVGLAGLKRKKA